METTLRALYDHDRWATLALMDHLAGLPPETLELDAPGTYGSIGATLIHSVDAAEGYLARIESWYRQRSGRDLAAGGVSFRVFEVDDVEPITMLRKLLRNFHDADQARPFGTHAWVWRVDPTAHSRHR